MNVLRSLYTWTTKIPYSQQHACISSLSQFYKKICFDRWNISVLIFANGSWLMKNTKLNPLRKLPTILCEKEPISILVMKFTGILRKPHTMDLICLTWASLSSARLRARAIVSTNILGRFVFVPRLFLVEEKAWKRWGIDPVYFCYVMIRVTTLYFYHVIFARARSMCFCDGFQKWKKHKVLEEIR